MAAYSLNEAEEITVLGDNMIIVVSEGQIFRIKAADLGISGGGLPSYSRPGWINLPGQAIASSIAAATLPAANTVKGYILPAGDYTGMTAALIPTATSAAVNSRAAIYELGAGATLPVGNLIADLGEINKTAGTAAVLAKAPTAIGVQNNPFYLVVFHNTNAGNWQQLTTQAVNHLMPQPDPAFASAMWRQGGTLAYPGAAPSTVSLLREGGATNFHVLAPL